MAGSSATRILSLDKAASFERAYRGWDGPRIPRRSRILETQGTPAWPASRKRLPTGTSRTRTPSWPASPRRPVRSLMRAMRESIHACGDIPLARLRVVRIGYLTFAASQAITLPRHVRTRPGGPVSLPGALSGRQRHTRKGRRRDRGLPARWTCALCGAGGGPCPHRGVECPRPIRTPPRWSARQARGRGRRAGRLIARSETRRLGVKRLLASSPRPTAPAPTSCLS